MIWPAQLQFTFISRKTGQVINNLIVYFVIYADTKNDYSLGPLVSDSRGQITITKEQLIKTIQETQTDSPMDYTGDLSVCRGKMLVRVEDKNKLKERIQRLNQFYPVEAEQLRNLMKDSANLNVGNLEKELESTSSPILVEVDDLKPNDL